MCCLYELVVESPLLYPMDRLHNAHSTNCSTCLTMQCTVVNECNTMTDRQIVETNHMAISLAAAVPTMPL